MKPRELKEVIERGIFSEQNFLVKIIDSEIESVCNFSIIFFNKTVFSSSFSILVKSKVLGKTNPFFSFKKVKYRYF